MAKSTRLMHASEKRPQKRTNRVLSPVPIVERPSALSAQQPQLSELTHDVTDRLHRRQQATQLTIKTKKCRATGWEGHVRAPNRSRLDMLNPRSPHSL